MSLDTFIAERQGAGARLEAAIKTAKRGRLRNQSASDIERFGTAPPSDVERPRDRAPRSPGRADHGVPQHTVRASASAALSRQPWRLGAIGPFFATALPRSFRAAWPYMVASLAYGDRVHRGLARRRPASRPPRVTGPAVALRRDGARPDRHRRAGCAVVGVDIIQNNIRVALICFAGGMLLGHPHRVRAAQQRVDARHRGGGRSARRLRLPVLVADRAPRRARAQRDRDQRRDRASCSATPSFDPGSFAEARHWRAWRYERCCSPSGAASLLIIAGTLEAFVSPSSLPDAVKLAVGAGVGLLLYSWLLLAGRTPRRRTRVRVRPSGGNPRVDWS